MGVGPSVAIAVAVLVSLTGLFVSGPAVTPAADRTAAPPRAGPEPGPGNLSAGPGAAGAASLPLGDSLPLSFTLRFSNESRLASLLQAQENPRSPQFRQFLSASQFRAEFAPTPSAVEQVRSELLAAGATAERTVAGRLAVQAVLPVGAAEALLGVRIVSPVGAGPSAFYADGTPHLAGSLGLLVAGVGGLTGRDSAARLIVPSTGAMRPVPAYVEEVGTHDQWQFGSDYATAFGAPQLWPGTGSVAGATYPTQEAVATILASAYNSTTQSNLPGFDPAVVRAYFNATLGPGWPMPTVTGVPVALAGVSTPPAPGSFGGRNDSTEDEFENSLDIEMAGSVAPGAGIYNFYFAGSQMVDPLLGVSALADDFGADLAAALNYPYGSQNLSVVSGSFGLPELNDSLWNMGLTQAAAMGVTVVSASGDQGDAPDGLTHRGSPLPTWPATAAFGTAGAISVGGTTLLLAGSPTDNVTATSIDPAYDPYVTGVASASTWYEHSGFGSYAGSEGGVGENVPEPSWQFHSAAQPAVVNATERQGAVALGRSGPDLSFPANGTIAYVFANQTGTVFLDVLAGTSVAAPAFAGLLADIDGVRSNRAGRSASVGFLAPDLYRIASFYADPSVRNTSLEPTDPFLDVTTGHNYLFSAADGWDPTTGWGEPNGPKLLAALANATIDGYVYTGPTPTLPPHAKSPLLTSTEEYYLLAVGALVAVALAVVALRPVRRPVGPGLPPILPVGPDPNAAGRRTAPGGLTFLCPYCGAPRPSEPVHCPTCGAL